MVVKVYLELLSQPCRSLLIFLKQTDIPFEVVKVDLAKQEHKKPDYTNIFPLGQVPGIQDDDFALAETVSIFRFLIGKYGDKVPDHWYPKDLQKRARVDEYLAWHHTGTRKGCATVFFNEVLVHAFKLPAVSEEQMKKDLATMETTLDNLENVFLKDKQFLTGDEISIADIMAASEIMQNISTGHDVTEGRPKLKAFIERVKERTNPAFDEAHKSITFLAKTLPFMKGQ